MTIDGGNEMYQIGDVAFYNAYGICTITGIEDRDFHGEAQPYYILHSTHYPTLTLYHPVNSDNPQLKKVLSELEAVQLLNCFKQPASAWEERANTRSQQFKVILNSQDHLQIAQLMNTLCRKKVELEAQEKKLSPQDAQVLQRIAPILYDELATALNIKKEQMAKKIDQLMQQ